MLRRVNIKSSFLRALAAVVAVASFMLFAPGAAPPPAYAATLPSGFSETTVFSGLTNPTVLRFARDGRVFVAEKSGLIKVFDNLSDTDADGVRGSEGECLQLLGSRAARDGARPELPRDARTCTSSTRTTTSSASRAGPAVGHRGRDL